MSRKPLRSSDGRLLGRLALLFGVLAVLSACANLVSSAPLRKWTMDSLLFGAENDSTHESDEAAPFGYARVKTYHHADMRFNVPHPNELFGLLPETHRPDIAAHIMRATATESSQHQPDERDAVQTAPHSNRTVVNGTSSSHHVSLELDSMRETMINTKWMSNTDGSSQNSMSFLRNFPRQKADGDSGHNQLQRLGGPANRSAETAAEEDPIADYIAGMFFMWGVPVLFAMIALVCWFGFCIARCWCNVCGRHATRLYTDKQIRVNYVLMLLLITIMGVCCAFGWTGNVQVSQGVDKCFLAADEVANYGYEFMGVFSTAYAIAYDATLLGISFNQTLALLPPDSAIPTSQACTTQSRVLLNEQGVFVGNLTNQARPFTSTAQFSSAELAMRTHVGVLAAARTNLSAPLTSTPPGGTAGGTVLTNLQKQLTDLNGGFSSLPSSTDIESLITSLTDVQVFSTNGGSSVAGTNLKSAVDSVNTASIAVVPTLSTKVSTDFASLEGSIDTTSSGLACPNEGTAGTQCTVIQNTIDTLSSSDASLVDSTIDDAVAKLQVLQSLSGLLTQVTTFKSGLTSLNNTLSPVSPIVDAYRTSVGAAYWPTSSSTYTDVANGGSPLSQFETSFGATSQYVLITSLPTMIQGLNKIRTSYPSVFLDPAGISTSITNFNTTTNLQLLTCFDEVFELVKLFNDTFVILPTSITVMYDQIRPSLKTQLNHLPELYSAMSTSQSELSQAQATIDPHAAPSYTTLLGAVRAMHAVTDTMTTFPALFEELLQLHSSLYDLAGTYPVVVTRGSTNTLWGDVASVTDGGATYPISSRLQAITDLTNAVQLSTPLTSLTSLVQDVTSELQSTAISHDSLGTYQSYLSNMNTQVTNCLSQLTAQVPVTSAPLSPAVQSSLTSVLTQLQTTLIQRPSTNGIRNAITNLQNSLSPLASSIRPPIVATADLLVSIGVGGTIGPIATRLRTFQQRASIAATPYLQGVLANPPQQLVQLQTEFDTNGTIFTANSLGMVAFTSNLTLPSVTNILTILNQPTLTSMSPTDETTINTNLDKLSGIRSSLPDFNDKIADGESALGSMTSALTWMEEKKQSYQKHKTDFQSTIDNYDGVRLLIFNLGVLAPFALSFFILIAAIQHYGCPAMIAGIVFFPLFTLFMLMAAVQMPISVALSDHCYNTTGEIKIQTAGRYYERSKLEFFDLQEDINVPDVTDYFTGCIGSAPELLLKLRDPLPVLRANNLESSQIQANAKAAIGLPFATPLQEDFDALDVIQRRAVDVFGQAVDKLNCTRSGEIYNSALSAICDDFGPAFALTTCVFLMTAVCMVPGICIGITSYKRFDAKNSDTAYTKAPSEEEAMREIHEGWN